MNNHHCFWSARTCHWAGVWPLLAALSFAALPCISGAADPLPSFTGKVLLVDDDPYYNNSDPENGGLSVSDQFFRNQLKKRKIEFDTAVVPTNENGPNLERLSGYSLVIWYTGANYGGNPDNTAVVSFDDAKTLQAYLSGGGSLLLVSPGYIDNVLGAGQDDWWEKSTDPLLLQGFGLLGGEGLARRFESAEITGAAGTRYLIGTRPELETQFSALNPGNATPLFNTPLEIAYKGILNVAVATAFTRGASRAVYVAFTIENAVEPIDPLLNPTGSVDELFGAVLGAVMPTGAPATPPVVAGASSGSTEVATGAATTVAPASTPPPYLTRVITTSAFRVGGKYYPPYTTRTVTTNPFKVTGKIYPPYVTRTLTTNNFKVTGVLPVISDQAVSSDAEKPN